MSESEFAELQHRLKSGQSVIDVPRSVARQFFIRVTGKEVKQETGETVTLQKLTVFAGLIAAPLLLVLCFVLVAFNFGFWSAAFIPLLGVFWTVLTMLNFEDSEWQVVTATLVAALLVYAFLPNDYTGPLALFVASIWVYRMTFLVARYYLVKLLLNSYHTFEQLADHVTEIER